MSSSLLCYTCRNGVYSWAEPEISDFSKRKMKCNTCGAESSLEDFYNYHSNLGTEATEPEEDVSTSDLKPCPLCNGEAKKLDFNRIACKACGLRTVSKQSYLEAVKLWNTRVVTPVSREEALEEFRMDELDGVMHSVDKWFSEHDPRLKLNPATRAAAAREIALKAIERS